MVGFGAGPGRSSMFRYCRSKRSIKAFVRQEYHVRVQFLFMYRMKYQSRSQLNVYLIAE